VANFFCKEPENKYFRPCSLEVSVAIGQNCRICHRQNKWVWLPARKTPRVKRVVAGFGSQAAVNQVLTQKPLHCTRDWGKERVWSWSHSLSSSDAGHRNRTRVRNEEQGWKWKVTHLLQKSPCWPPTPTVCPAMPHHRAGKTLTAEVNLVHSSRVWTFQAWGQHHRVLHHGGKAGKEAKIGPNSSDGRKPIHA
jgi:hypothetical protein